MSSVECEVIEIEATLPFEQVTTVSKRALWYALRMAGKARALWPDGHFSRKAVEAGMTPCGVLVVL